MKNRILNTDDSKATILIRLMVGAVFLSEGIQKFLFAETLGAGRFEKIGLPAPEFWGSVVGSCEIVCGLLILLGLFKRAASIPLTKIMLVAMTTTKSQILADKVILGNDARKQNRLVNAFGKCIFVNQGRWLLVRR